jgi:hypothetical protein
MNSEHRASLRGSQLVRYCDLVAVFSKTTKSLVKVKVAFILLVGISGCETLREPPDMVEPLSIHDSNPFKPGHEIKRSDPSIEEIVLSMNFLRREDPFELMRYWVDEGFDGVWKGADWIDLFEGEGEYPPIAVEKIPSVGRTTVKVIVWVRKAVAGDGSPYTSPYLRHEYILELEGDGWRRKEKLVKLGPASGDRVYLYDARAPKPREKGS